MLFIGESVDWSKYEEIEEDQVKERIEISIENNSILITSKFIDYYYSYGDLSNDLVLLSSCHSGQSNELAESFLNNGASAVVGFTEEVYAKYGIGIIEEAIEYMSKIDETTGEYFTLSDALEKAKKDLGNDDLEWLNNTHPLLKKKSSVAKPKIFPVNNETANNYRLANVIKPDDIVDSGKCGDNITYTLYGDGRLLLSGSGTMWDYDKREDVPWYNSRSNIKVVGFDGNITHIGNRIFGDCSNLTTISIPSTVTSIGDAAFSECTGLTELTIPDSVTSIGTAAFSDCRGLTNITVPYFATNIGDFVFGNCSGLTQAIIQSSSATIPKMMFANCSSLKAVYIPKTVTSVGDSAFFKCDSLTDVYYSGSQSEWNNISISNMNNAALTNATLHCSGTDNGAVVDSGKCGDDITYTLYENGLLELSGSGDMYDYDWDGQRAPWDSCKTSITKVQVNNKITSIGKYAFGQCGNMTCITIPESVTSIGYRAFWCCESLTSITIPNSVTSIGNAAFQFCYSLTSITIPNSVTSIGDEAFSCCDSLENITVPNYITSIGDAAFFQCYSLKSITIPNSVTSIGMSAFSSCSSLTSITIPNSVTSISESAFSFCSSLTNVTIPNSVTSIGYSAFEDCSRLTNVTIPNSVTSIGDSAFFECSSLTNITIPNSVTSIGTHAFRRCDSLTNINVSEGNNKYSSFDGLLLDKNKTKVIVCPPGKSESITIPDSVTSIGDVAFYECRSLTSITIPNSVTLGFVHKLFSRLW